MQAQPLVRIPPLFSLSTEIPAGGCVATSAPSFLPRQPFEVRETAALTLHQVATRLLPASRLPVMRALIARPDITMGGIRT